MTVAVAAAAVGPLALPAVASAKRSRPLTKAQVIGLIHRYASPGQAGPAGTPGKDGAPGSNGAAGSNGANGTNGPTGPTGPTGLAGTPGGGAGQTYTAGSGLSLINSVFAVDPTVVQLRVSANCASSFQVMTGVAQSGAPICDYPSLVNSTNGTTQIKLTNFSTTGVGTTVVGSGIGGPLNYWVTATTSLANTGANSEYVSCWLDDGSGTAFATGALDIPSGKHASLTVQSWQHSTANQTDHLVCAATDANTVVTISGLGQVAGTTSNIAAIALNSLSGLG